MTRCGDVAGVRTELLKILAAEQLLFQLTQDLLFLLGREGGI
jgi:hypothetical protein